MRLSARKKRAALEILDRIQDLIEKAAGGAGCGAGAPGRPGFQPGNQCGGGGGAGGSGGGGGSGSGKPSGSGSGGGGSVGGVGGGGAAAIADEDKTPPPPGPAHKPDVESDDNGDGITDAARVGVGAFDVPPPPRIGRLPNLTDYEREVEGRFIGAYEADPDGVASSFRAAVIRSAKPGEPPTFGTDDAKAMTDTWDAPDMPLETRSRNRATLNAALHQTANAIAKRAFLQHLDTLQPGDEVMITVGGCGAGKGYALGNVPQALEAKRRSKAVWDSAGDQCATESPWIQEELERRGLVGTYVYVHADPRQQWADPTRGVVKRAGDPKDGRMVDAKVFADSYALGARNHKAFAKKNKGNPKAKFIYLANQGKPVELPDIPDEALTIDRRELARFAMDTVQSSGAPEHVVRGALVGARIWEDD